MKTIILLYLLLLQGCYSVEVNKEINIKANCTDCLVLQTEKSCHTGVSLDWKKEVYATDVSNAEVLQIDQIDEYTRLIKYNESKIKIITYQQECSKKGVTCTTELFGDCKWEKYTESSEKNQISNS